MTAAPFRWPVLASLLRTLFLCTLLQAGAVCAQVVKVYTSANFAPLMLSDGRGVYADLVAHLNTTSPGGLSFELHYLPRKRLQLQLETDTIDGVVIGMMPEWLDDRRQQRYLWSAPFASDRYVLVSPAARALRPDAAALAGASIGVTADYVYHGIERWIDKSRMVRSKATSDEKSLEQVLHGSLDGAIVAESMARYFIRVHKLGDRLHVATLPTLSERRFVAPRRLRAVFDKIAPVIAKLRDDPAWKEKAARYE
jgi:polar amino acid transport system substrate-binding protein